MTIIVIDPNGLVEDSIRLGDVPANNLLPPYAPFREGSFSLQVDGGNNFASSYCFVEANSVGGTWRFGPTISGTYTFMPYAQYSFGANGYRHENGVQYCIDAPYTGRPTS